MAAPGGILHKVQLHFEKCIQFTAVSALSFSCFSPLMKKKKNIPGIYLRPLLLLPLYLCWGKADEFWGLRSHDLSLQKHQKQEHKHASLNSVQTLFGALPFVALVPRSTLNVPYAFQTDDILWVLGLKILQRGDEQQLNNNENIS